MNTDFLVIGEMCTDTFVYGKSNRLSPEAPIPIFSPIKTLTNDGMAKNVYNNLLALIQKNNSSSRIQGIFSENLSNKMRFVDIKTNHYFLRVDYEDDFDRIKFDSHSKRLISESNCIIISDYNKGYLDIEDVKKIYKLKKATTPIFIDTKKKLIPEFYDWVDFIKLNEKEYTENVTNSAKKIHNNKFIVTLGEKGAMYKHKVYASETPQNTIDVSGAGDTFLAALVYDYMLHSNMELAIEYANTIAGIVVTKKGVSTI